MSTSEEWRGAEGEVAVGVGTAPVVEMSYTVMTSWTGLLDVHLLQLLDTLHRKKYGGGATGVGGCLQAI